MLFVLSKLFNFITSPINWIIGLLIISLLINKGKLRHWLWGITLFITLVLTNNQLYVLAINAWSKPFQTQLDSSTVYEIAIVAGGTMAYSQNWRQIDYNDQADRLTEAIRLYRQGRIKKLFLSGEAAFNVKGDITYALQFIEYMKEMGVNPGDIVLEQHARTTRENIKNLKQLLPANSADKPILLITSGWHMRRMIKGFRGSGLNFVPYSVDVPSLHPAQEWQDYLPSWRAALNWQKLFHEMFGMLLST